MCKTKSTSDEIDEIATPENEPRKSWKDYMKHLHIIFWHELSMDPRVRRSPYHDPPENEIHLKSSEIFIIRFRRVIALLLHILGVGALWLIFSGRVHSYTVIWSFFIFYISRIGITAGSHRLWSHNAYKATRILCFILMIFSTVSLELSAIGWARVHRAHHKYCDTDADPVNAVRGFFFSHIGWLLIQEHPEVTEKTKTIWLNDLKNDSILAFQDRFYWPLAIIFAYAMPVFVPWYLWNENIWICHLVPFVLTTILSKHLTYSVNSIAHIYGTKPYSKKATATDTNVFISCLWTGEGWHNFHHAFPWDYRNSEFVGGHNLGALFIDFCAWLGLAYDLKIVADEKIAHRVINFGDGSHKVWGWKDKANTPEQMAATQMEYSKYDKEF